jgi:hypothetical protein
LRRLSLLLLVPLSEEQVKGLTEAWWHARSVANKLTVRNPKDSISNYVNEAGKSLYLIATLMSVSSPGAAV